MLLEWKIGNFKSIAEPITLKLAPLTILVGANSSGKSTILQSILAATQTLTSPSSERPFILNGEFLKLGLVTDVLYQGKVSAPFEFGFSLQTGAEFLSVSSPSNLGQLHQVSPSETHARVDVRCSSTTSSFSDALRLTLDGAFIETRTAKIEIGRQEPQKHPGVGVRFADIDNYSVLELEYPAGGDPPFGAIAELRVGVEHFLPGFLWEPYNVVVEQVTDALSLCAKYLTKDDEPPWVLARLDKVAFATNAGREFRVSLRNVLRSPTRRDSDSQSFELAWQLMADSRTAGEWYRKAVMRLNASTRSQIMRGLRQEQPATLKRLEGDSSLQHEIGLRRRALPERLESARGAIVNYFTKRIWYLGPLRDDPRAIYELPPIPEDSDVGLRGEYTASVLQHHQTDTVVCPLPESGFGMEEMPLGKAVSRWLGHMDLVDKVTTSDRGKFGTELSLHLAHVDRSLDLTNVGVGVSQVLPSIVMGLLAPSESTLLLEQPELHLHPKVQSILGDFLIGLARSGRQCIVETHSEYLVNRLRRRIAEAPGDSVQKLIQIYFVERIEGRSVFRAVEPNDYGAIPDWPKGFFDQGPDEAQLIIQAATKKRQDKLDSMAPPKR